MSTLGTILKDNWEWRSQIVQLAIFDLRKQSRGAALGWAWFFIKPVVYVFCFWFAIEIGLKAGKVDPNGPPYILWLSAGIGPWFFIRDMLNGGIDIFRKYPYLVKKIKFPISGISNIYTLSSFFIELMILVMLTILYFVCGQKLDWYLLQVPVLLILMYVFWFFFSVLMSPLCVMSKDMKNLMGVLSTPFFWLSGVIFNLRDISFDWIQTILYFNPITFFVTAFRDALYYKTWIWEDPMLCLGFTIVFIVTAMAALFVYAKTNEKVADVF